MHKASSRTTAELISVDTRSRRPLQQQLVERVRDAIRSGQLAPGTSLPSSRALAGRLGISRTTVYAAYEQLRLEGYIEGRRGSRTVVASIIPERAIATGKRGARVTRASAQVSGAISPRLERVIATPYAPSLSGKPRPFRVGTPALDEFPADAWTKLLAQVARRSLPSSLGYLESGGYRPLRNAIATYLRLVRGVVCSQEQVVITSGVQGAIHIALSAMVEPDDAVWVEDPGFLGARGAAHIARARVVPVPVDDRGLDVAEGIRRAPNARVAIVTPSHHFPTGVTLAPERRAALLQWAQRESAWIIEDDYDSEYRYVGHPAPALQGFDPTRVLYAGSFSKVMFPALRIGYLVVPEDLAESLLSMRRFIDTHPPTLEQMVLTRFIEEGGFERHVRRMRVLYRERRDALVDALAETLGDRATIGIPDGGMNLVAWMNADDAALSVRAAAIGVEAPAVSRYQIEPGRAGLVLGYAPFDIPALRSATRRLAEAIG